MNDIFGNSQEPNDSIDEMKLMEMLGGMDDDLIDRQIEQLLAEKGEFINMDNVKEKAFEKLEKGKRKRGLGKKVAVVAAVAALTVSTVYATDIQRALQSFFGKSTVYQAVVDGEAYYLPDKIALGEKFALRYANMSEGNLELMIAAKGVVSDAWYEGLELSVAEPNGGENYKAGGYGFFDGALNVFFYEMPTLSDFDIIIEGEAYPVSLAKAESFPVDENLVIGVSENEPSAIDGEESTDSVQEKSAEELNLPLLANVAASRNDGENGVGISIAVGFEDRNLKLSALGESEVTVFNATFENNETGVISSGNGPMTEPLVAHDSSGNPYELTVPAGAVSRPVTVFETDAATGTPLTLKVPAIQAHYEKEVDRITLTIPESGETEVGESVNFIAQEAIVKSIKRTSETTAEIKFQLNTGADKSVKIRDISAYSRDVQKGETIIEGDTAVLTLTFEENTQNAEIEFSWPYFTINGNWTIELK